MTTITSGQLDLLTGEPTAVKPAKPKPAGPTRFRRAASSQPCAGCLDEQYHRHVKGLPTDFRRPATVVMTRGGIDTHLCESHARVEGYNPVAQRTGGGWSE